MKIQGWNSVMLSQVVEKGILSSLQRTIPILYTANKDATEPVPTSQSEVRSELLAKIKQKIKSGYYNSDSVIDDIGYGFAQAIDNSL